MALHTVVTVECGEYCWPRGAPSSYPPLQRTRFLCARAHTCAHTCRYIGTLQQPSDETVRSHHCRCLRSSLQGCLSGFSTRGHAQASRCVHGVRQLTNKMPLPPPLSAPLLQIPPDNLPCMFPHGQCSTQRRQRLGRSGAKSSASFEFLSKTNGVVL